MATSLSLVASSSLALTFSCSIQRKPTIVSFSSSVISYPNNPKFHLLTPLGSLSLNNGLSHLGISIRRKNGKTEKRGRCRGKVVYASLFGVGAPEALVIGVVALLVFGPKGLAEVARNLGKTLRAFQPTIRELQEVSREFKSTLEREIGLDEIPPSTSNTSVSSPSYVKESPQAMVDPNGTPTTKTPFPGEEHLKVTEEQLNPSAAETSTPEEQLQDSTSPAKTPYSSEEYLKITEEQLKASAANQQIETPTPQAAAELAAGTPPSEKPEMER